MKPEVFNLIFSQPLFYCDFPQPSPKKPPHKNVLSGTLPLGLAGSGTNKFSALTLENLKYRPLDDALLKQLFRFRLDFK